MSPSATAVLSRLACVTLGLYLTGGGIATIAAGRATHVNYLQAPTSAAAALTVGVLLLFAGTLGWKWLSRYL